ncbi:ORF6C domain-containing protein [Lysinibacillus sp. FSL P4-0201]|uniref:ORF6C domain-containing protein n=1 Tax=Lysinibacillus sp. FSL P4-0201 TaxID=2921721 RepID=UPI00315ABAFF
MNQLVFIENNEVVTDSLAIAEMFEKAHDKVVRDIENQITKLKEAGEGEWGVANFDATQYQHPQNKQWYQKYNLTEDGFAIVVMSYVTPSAMKMKVKFIQEFKRMKEFIQQLSQPILTVEQQRREHLKLSIETSERVDMIESKLDKVVSQMRIDGVEQQNIQQKGAYKVMQALGGKDSPAYNKISRKVFKSLWGEFNRYFSIPRYSELPKINYEEGQKFISMWQPSTSLRLEIEQYNRQVQLKLVKA